MVELPRLPGRRVHVVGAGGAGMSGLAKLLSQLGFEVTGSDLKPTRTLDLLGDVGVRTWVGHRPDEIADVDLVVASSAVPDRDPELAAASAGGIPIWRRPRLLRALTEAMPTAGFAGTHGKTTSTAMAVAALRGTGADPSFVVGGELVDDYTNAHLGTDELLVLEADEAFGTFRHLHLRALMVTNVEADHLDHYGTVLALEDAFRQVALAVEGPVVGCVDDPGVRRLARAVDVVGYGTDPAADWRIVEPVVDVAASRFVLAGPGVELPVTVPKPGMHVVRNAAGVLVLLGALGYGLDGLAAGLGDFGGVRRRWEVRARIGDVVVVEDYAHHPTEIAATLDAARRAASGRVHVVFQPHRYSRTADLGPAFGAPLAAADEVLVTEVYPAGERPIPGVTGRVVADAVAAAGGRVRFVPELGEIPGVLGELVAAGDVVLLLGAGDVGTIADAVARVLEEGR